MLLLARSFKLDQALKKAKEDGLVYLILGGTLIPIDQVRPFFAGKHRMHGMNLQVIAGPDGTIVWVSGPMPGSTHRQATTSLRARARRSATHVASPPFCWAHTKDA